MSKNVVVNGESFNAVSTVALTLAAGGTALFRDVDEASGSVDGIVEIACGSFSVSAMTDEYTIKHGMSVAPDVVAIIPKYWHDTIDKNFAVLGKSKYAGATGGRRAIDGATTHFQGFIGDGSADWSTEIAISTSTLAQFQPTYTDADGKTGTQIYLWVAVKFAE